MNNTNSRDEIQLDNQSPPSTSHQPQPLTHQDPTTITQPITISPTITQPITTTTTETVTTPTNSKSHDKINDKRSWQGEELELNDETTSKDNSMRGIRFYLLILGLFLVIFTAILDHSILSAALGHIVSEFNALNDISWIPASYMLTTTSLIPLYGKLSDIFGRRNTLTVALLIFMVGSILCGFANSMSMLIISRAFSGIGGGGLIALAIIIISDIVPLKQRSLYLSMTGIFFMIAVTSGPLIGGIISDSATWRWNFFINVPIGLIALITTSIFLNLPYKMESLGSKLKRIDFLGAITIILSTSLLLLGLNWGGKEFPWSSWQVILTLVSSVFVMGCFIYVELKVASEPLLPRSIFTRNVISANVTNLLNGFPFYVTVNYIPIYYQVVHLKNATMSAFELLPMLLCITILSALAGYYTARTGQYRIFNVVGTGLILIGVSLGLLMRQDISRPEEIIFIILIGCGYGLCTQNCTILSQAAVHEEDIASVTAFLNFTANLGGVLGLALIGTIYKTTLSTSLHHHLPHYDLNYLTSSLTLTSQLPPSDLLLYQLSYTEAIRYSYLGMIPFAAISFLASLFLIHIPLPSHQPITSHQIDPADRK